VLRGFGKVFRKGMNHILAPFGWRVIRIGHARADIEDIADSREDFRIWLEYETKIVEDMFISFRSVDTDCSGEG